jgi:large subunit ribosomal protein L19e
MNTSVQKRLAAQISGCSPKRVIFDNTKLSVIKEALTRADIRDLIESGAITVRQKNGQSRVRARYTAAQKSRGLRKGPGSRKGSSNARENTKDAWVRKVRLMRVFAKDLVTRNKITTQSYRNLYRKIKANVFKDRTAIKLYLEENGLFVK